MNFVPITSNEHLKTNSLILQSILFIVVGLYLIVAQTLLNLSAPLGAICNYFFGGSSIFLGLVGLLIGKRFTSIIIAVNQTFIFASLLFIFFSTTDASKSSIMVLLALIVFVLLNNIFFDWKVTLAISIAIISLISIRLFLVQSGKLELASAQNAQWIFNVNVIVVLLFGSIIMGYFGAKLSELMEKTDAEHLKKLQSLEAKQEVFHHTSTKVEAIDEIFQEKADEINAVVVENANILSTDTTATYEELLSVASKVAKSVDDVILTINTQIQQEESTNE
jgi:hypothetical protein